MSTTPISGESLYEKGRRLHQQVLYNTGTMIEAQNHYASWTNFCEHHPEIASQVSSPDPLPTPMDLDGTNSRWDDAEQNQRFISKWHWNVFLSAVPIGAGFRDEVQSLVRVLRTHLAQMQRHNSLLGERYLVGWVLHHIPAPTQYFLRWSLDAEEFEPDWTITALEEHLSIWAALFEDETARNYRDRCFREEFERRQQNPSLGYPLPYLFLDQKRTGGGPMAHFLAATPDHRRTAYQLFKELWRQGHEGWAERLGGGRPMKDVFMTGM